MYVCIFICIYIYNIQCYTHTYMHTYLAQSLKAASPAVIVNCNFYFLGKFASKDCILQQILPEISDIERVYWNTAGCFVYVHNNFIYIHMPNVCLSVCIIYIHTYIAFLLSLPVSHFFSPLSPHYQH
jgi:hypothetical protein